MCDRYSPCLPKRRLRSKTSKKFNMLLLDCWQREYDQRPYKHFIFKILDFEDRMMRRFNPIKDFVVIIDFLHNRKLDSVSITGLNATTRLKLEMEFASGLFNLQYLELKLMNLPDSFFDQLVANVDRMHLKEIVLEGTKLSYVALVDLRLYLIAAKNLHYINVNSCNIDQMNFSILADGVHKSSSITRFAFGRLLGNHLSIDSQKIIHIISSLIWQNKLEEIDMHQCELLSQDMEIISEYLLKKCSKLRKLNISCNIIGSDGAEYLLSSISKSGTMTHLDMSCCSLGTHGGDVVAKYLSSCFHLEFLNIRFNDIGSEAMNNILTMLKKRIKLLSLKVYGNHFDAKTGKILNRLLKSRVLPQDSIDITVTFEEDLDYFRIVPYY